MTTISQEQIEETYRLGKLVYSRKLGRTKAIHELSTKLGMNEASAGHYLRAITKMLEGDLFQHNISLAILVPNE